MVRYNLSLNLMTYFIPSAGDGRTSASMVRHFPQVPAEKGGLRGELALRQSGDAKGEVCWGRTSVLQLVADVMAGVREVHSFKLAHCDIRGANIVQARQGRRRIAVVIDPENCQPLTDSREARDYRDVGRLLLRYMSELDTGWGRALYLRLARGRLQDMRDFFRAGWEVREDL